MMTETEVYHPLPEPTPEMRATPEFQAVLACIESWPILPDASNSFCTEPGRYARAILEAIAAVEPVTAECEACGGRGRIGHPSGVLLERCPACEGKGTTDALDTTARD